MNYIFVHLLDNKVFNFLLCLCVQNALRSDLLIKACSTDIDTYFLFTPFRPVNLQRSFEA